MDTRSLFAFVLVAIGLGGLVALATGNLTIANGQIVIGPQAAAASTSSSTTAAPAAGAGVPDMSNAAGGSYSTSSIPTTTLSGVPNASAVANVIGGGAFPTGGSTSLSTIYSGTTPLVATLGGSGDGVAVNPFGVAASS